MPDTLRATIDRLESDERGRRLAVLVFDDEQQLVVPAELLPRGSRASDVLTLGFELDRAETESRAERIDDLQRKLFGG